MCRHADSFDRGLFGSVFDYSMDLWSEQPDDSCVLHFRPKRRRGTGRVMGSSPDGRTAKRDLTRIIHDPSSRERR
jgi:hypothetical protein